MMDIEKLQKINMLAKELMQHGICKTMDEAYRQAGKSIETENPLSLGNEDLVIPETTSEEKKQDPVSPSFHNTVFAQTTMQPKQQETISQEPNQQSMYGMFEIRKLKEQVTMLEGQLSGVSSKMNEMISEINKLQSQKNGSASMHSGNTPQQNGMSMPEKKVGVVDTRSAMEAVSAPIPVQIKTPEAHPRSGDYKPGDVSIEKMFYFGGGARRL